MGQGAGGAAQSSVGPTPRSYCSRGSKGSNHHGLSDALLDAARRIARQLCRDRLDWDPLADAGELKGFSIFKSVDLSTIEELMRLAARDVRCQRAVGSMMGMAAADSVGGRLEFLPVGQKGSRFDPKTARVIGELNKFHLKPGQWTDDTSMGLCVADSLLVCSGYDGADLRLRFWNWWNRGYNNAFRYDDSRDRSVGLGGNISMSLLMMSNTPASRYEGLGDAAGNGSLMRLAPMPIYFHSDEDIALRVSAEQSYTTHPAQGAADACAFLGFVIARAITRDSKRWETASAFLDKCAEDYLARPEASAQADLARLIRAEEPSGSPERCWNWRDPAGPFILETLAARGSIYNGHPVSADYFGSYCMDALAIALHSVYHTRSFMAAMSLCVNFLGDADSTGSVCGQVAGAFYGAHAIDPRIVAQVREWDVAGEIPLRGALLYALGSELTEEDLAQAKARSAQALDWDRQRSHEEDLRKLASLEPLPALPSERPDCLLPQTRRSIGSNKTPTLLRKVK